LGLWDKRVLCFSLTENGERYQDTIHRAALKILQYSRKKMWLEIKHQFDTI
jgi:uncharacterized protein YueI